METKHDMQILIQIRFSIIDVNCMPKYWKLDAGIRLSLHISTFNVSLESYCKYNVSMNE